MMTKDSLRLFLRFEVLGRDNVCLGVANPFRRESLYPEVLQLGVSFLRLIHL